MREELDEIAEELNSMVDAHVESTNNIKDKHAEFKDKFEELAESNDLLANEVFDDWAGLFESIEQYVN
jgi:hypothetical protein